MKRELVLRHEFVEFIPDQLKDGTIYVSIPYATVAHKCCCGCGTEVVTPLSPADWTLIFDGESISLDPSIGNWSFDCKSHYWIRGNRVRWAERWSPERIKLERSDTRAAEEGAVDTPCAGGRADDPENKERPFWHRVRDWRRWLKR